MKTIKTSSLILASAALIASGYVTPILAHESHHYHHRHHHHTKGVECNVHGKDRHMKSTEAHKKAGGKVMKHKHHHKKEMH